MRATVFRGKGPVSVRLLTARYDKSQKRCHQSCCESNNIFHIKKLIVQIDKPALSGAYIMAFQILLFYKTYGFRHPTGSITDELIRTGCEVHQV